MIHSLFILNSTGEVIIEKHWRGNARRSDSVTFWGQTVTSSKGEPTDLPPFLPTAKGALVHLYRNGLFFLASVLTDTQPLFVTQFLTSLADVFVDYFGELNEHAIKDNFITVYELLDEMLDNGLPLTMEPNTLKELIAPPSMLNRVFETLSGDSGNKATMSTASPLIPWRRAAVRYAQNEIFVDVIETVDATISSSSGRLVHGMIRGVVTVNCRLSGTPDLSMSIRSNAHVDDVALHHCVRYKKYHDSGQLSFVPPDGPFTLMSYIIREPRSFTLPIEVQSNIAFDHAAGSGTVSLSLVPRFLSALAASGVGTAPTSRNSGSLMLAQVMNATASKTGMVSEQDSMMDGVSVRIPFGPGVTGASLSSNYGTVQFDSTSGTCTWTVGSVPRGKTPTLIGNVSLHKDSTSLVSQPPILAKFRIPGFAPSGMFVERLEMSPPESYKYYKGLRCVTKAGLYEVRP